MSGLQVTEQSSPGTKTRSRWSRAWRWIKPVLALAVVGASLYFVGQRILADLGRQDWSAIELRPAGLIISLALTTVCVLLGGWVWRLILESLGYTLPLCACVRVHCFANLAKYVPGYAWQLMGKAYLTRELGVPAQIAGVGLVLEMGGLLTTAVLVGLVFWPLQAVVPIIGEPAIWLRLVLALTLVLALALSPTLISAWGKLATSRHWWGAGIRPHAASLWYAFLVMASAWCLFGLGLAASIAAVTPLTLVITQYALYALAFSFVVSLLILFVPGGIGVREGMLVMLLGSVLSPGLAGLVAIASRLVLMASELLAAGLVGAFGRRHS